MSEVKIDIYHKEEKVTTTLYVEQLSENKFRMIDNDFCNPKLTLRTEFETKINKDKKHKGIGIRHTQIWIDTKA